MSIVESPQEAKVPLNFFPEFRPVEQGGGMVRGNHEENSAIEPHFRLFSVKGPYPLNILHFRRIEAG